MKRILLASGLVVALTTALYLSHSRERSGARHWTVTPAAHAGAVERPLANAPATQPPLTLAEEDRSRAWIGGACAVDADCATRGGRCLTGPGFPTGYCTSPCKQTCPDRKGEAVTFCASAEVLGDAPSCVSRCDYDKFRGELAGCRAGYACVLAPRAGEEDVVESVCLPESTGPARGSARLPWRRYPGGKQALVRLAHAPYPHESRANGHTVDGVYYPRAGHYDDPSALIVVPRRFKDTGQVELVLHFHGFNGDIRRLVETKKLRQQFFAAKRNAVLVLVQGPKNVPDSFPGKLSEQGGFRNLVTELVGLLYADGLIAHRRLGSLALTSHSGGYRAVAAALDEHSMGRRIAEVYLFDSFYGDYGAFFEYAAKTRGRFVSIVTPELAGANAAFKARLRDARLPYGTRLTQDQRLTLLSTRLSHADAPRRGNFQRVLESAQFEEHP